MTGAILTGREKHPVIPLLEPEIEQQLLAIGEKRKVDEFYAIRAEAMKLEQADPFRNGFTPDIWKRADEALARKRAEYEVGVVEELDLGGNRACLVAGTTIFDPVRQMSDPIERKSVATHVEAWDGSGVVHAKAEPSFSRGVLPCVTVALVPNSEADLPLGEKYHFRCAATHKLLTQDGEWIEAAKIESGTNLISRNGTALVDMVVGIGEHECFDFHVPGYENYFHAGVCHHNSKTERAARKVVELAVNKPGAKIWCLQSTQTISRQAQQPLIWKYLPNEWKPVGGRSKRDLVTKINYTQAGGFTEDTVVLPNGSQIWWKFYSVSVADVEGPELDMTWADELITPEWLEFLRYRLVTRNGYLLTTFTPVEGYNATVKTYLDSAKTIEETEAELLPIRDESGEVKGYEKVPRIQQSGIDRAIIVYFHTADNPYGNYPSMRETLKGKSRETILMRAYGVPSKTFGAALPMFRRHVHVITVEQWMGWQKKYPNATRYHWVDPCSGRNWFMGWSWHPMPGKVIFYREWPSHGHLGAYIQGIGDPGPWTISGKASDGERGPAQTSFGFGLERYKQEIEKAEGKEVISERRMDSRSANMPTATREGTTTLIEQMEELGMEFLPMGASGKSIMGTDNDGSIDMINSALYFDLDTELGKFSKDMARINEPELLIVETCPNMIYAFENWTGRDGQQGACKDPIDLARGLFLSEADYISDAMMRPRTPWANQFGQAA